MQIELSTSTWKYWHGEFSDVVEQIGLIKARVQSIEIVNIALSLKLPEVHKFF